MNDSEINELKGFIADLKADRQATKDKEKREAWTKYTSLSIVFIAVLAAVATQYGGRYSSRVLVNLNDATFSQAKATDQWSYYEAKSIKQSLAENEHERLVHTGGADPALAALAAKLQAKVARYEKEKSEITKEAKSFEEKRDAARDIATLNSKLGGEMGFAVSLFQIAIAIASICLVMKKKPLWYLSLAVAALATAQMMHTLLH